MVAACVAFALWHLQPDLLIENTTPAGGDMGAHVWGPAYLRDHLLPHGQVAGWAPDWYAGFPAYQFYMVVPSLLIVALNAGVHGWLGVLPAAAGMFLGAAALFAPLRPRARTLAAVGAVGAFALVGLPYGVAFKLVSVSGIATLPVAAYAFGRLSGLRFPTPAVLAVGTLPFLFYRGFTIYGGNIASTLAGEFAFSMSLSLALVYLGLVFKGIETGRYRALTAVVLAATGLCHLIPAFWALGATAVIVAVRFRRSSSPGTLGYGLLAAAAFLALPAAGLAALGPVARHRGHHPGAGARGGRRRCWRASPCGSCPTACAGSPRRSWSAACCRCGGSARSTCGGPTSTTWAGRSCPTSTPTRPRPSGSTSCPGPPPTSTCAGPSRWRSSGSA